jgi:hypothetical protein
MDSLSNIQARQQAQQLANVAADVARLAADLQVLKSAPATRLSAGLSESLMMPIVDTMKVVRDNLRDEIDKLRDEVATLRSELRTAPSTPAWPAIDPAADAVARSALAAIAVEKQALDELVEQAAHLTGSEIQQRLAAMQSRLRDIDTGLH